MTSAAALPVRVDGTSVGTVLVTGATGFVGKAVVNALADAGVPVRATWHRRPPADRAGVEWRPLDLAGAVRDCEQAVAGVDAVLHLGARAHVTGAGRLRRSAFAAVNASGTARLASAACRAGVRRFVYVGTVGVHGGESRRVDGMPRPLSADDPLSPRDGYARSKLAGEQALVQACRHGNMEHVILRLPLVFGPGVGGNFLRLMRLVDLGLPVPAGPQPAPRTIACADNVAAALLAALRAPGVAGRAFLVGDFDVTVTDLAARLADLLGRPQRRVILPSFLLRGRALRSLTQPLLLDSAPFRAATGWRPAVDLNTALARTVAWYRDAG